MMRMDDNAGLYYILDGTVKDAAGPTLVDAYANRPVYEVIRIVRGIPLFFEDHLERIRKTFENIGKPMTFTADMLKDGIKKLVRANAEEFCNIKIIFFEKDGRQSILTYIIKSYYPSKEIADAGVRTGLIRLERNNPNAKLLNQNYRDAANAKMKEGGFFEVLLVDAHGFVTEGSRSNVFFVKDGRIFTAPGEYVLRGITRKYVFEACRKAGYEVVEQLLGEDGLDRVEGAFLSGTPIKVLPIASIDDRVLNSSANPVVAAVRREYESLLEKYIDDNVKIW
jgi:branched-chain amino acid aminotransferase